MSLDDYIDTIMMLESLASLLKITLIEHFILYLYIPIKSELLTFIFSLGRDVPLFSYRFLYRCGSAISLLVFHSCPVGLFGHLLWGESSQCLS